jgi:hypothetical protein
MLSSTSWQIAGLTEELRDVMIKGAPRSLMVSMDKNSANRIDETLARLPV